MYIWRILKVIATYQLHTLIRLPWYAFPLRIILFLLGLFTRSTKHLDRGECISRSLEELGVIFIKFGQVLSTRRDLLPEDIGRELSRLQDNCQPFSSVRAREIIERELGDFIGNVFTDFSETPIAAASIAQVYTATLHSGESVVVKVVRPDVEIQIQRDLKVLYRLAKVANMHSVLKRLRPLEVVKEFEFIIRNEPNMLLEASNARILKRNFTGSDLLYVPKVYEEYSTKHMLVEERIYGTSIGDLESIQKQGISMQHLAENGVKIFFTQVFKHNFFHADMHAGNIFVDSTGKYSGVDFGIMGSLTKEDRVVTALLFQAFFNEQYEKIAQLFISSGWIAEDTNKVALTNAFRLVCEPMFAKDLSEISFGEVLMNLFNEARKFDAYIQPQLLLLDKTLLAVEGLGRSIYPQLDLWQTAKPLLDDIIRTEFSIKAQLKELHHNAPELLYQVQNIPKELSAITTKLHAQQQLSQHNMRAYQHTKRQMMAISAVVILLLFLQL